MIHFGGATWKRAGSHMHISIETPVQREERKILQLMSKSSSFEEFMTDLKRDHNPFTPQEWEGHIEKAREGLKLRFDIQHSPLARVMGEEE